VISDSDAKMLMSSVLYKDEHLIVINKPSGLPVQGGTGQLKHLDGMSEVLKFGYPDKPRLVHRLDKDTSGVLLLARSAQAAKYLTAAFRHRETRKIYWAAVAGVPAIKTGTIKYGLVKMKGHGPDGMGEKMKCLHPDEVAQIDNAKRATTDYTIIDNAGQRVAWLALVPITGRTHQLRAHVSELGHPIVGDGKYGTNSQINEGDGWGSQLGGEISRKLHLHSKSLSFVHPFTKKMVNFSAPLPEHMLRTWDFLDWTPKEGDLDPFLSDEKKI
jgi:23S rRNA pseudouridine955/2504/2580 synthase